MTVLLVIGKRRSSMAWEDCS